MTLVERAADASSRRALAPTSSRSRGWATTAAWCPPPPVVFGWVPRHGRLAKPYSMRRLENERFRLGHVTILKLPALHPLLLLLVQRREVRNLCGVMTTSAGCRWAVSTLRTSAPSASSGAS